MPATSVTTQQVRGSATAVQLAATLAPAAAASGEGGAAPRTFPRFKSRIRVEKRQAAHLECHAPHQAQRKPMSRRPRQCSSMSSLSHDNPGSQDAAR